MSKAFIDTTILTDILLNSGEARKFAHEVLKKFYRTELPVFAIKELKAGPIKNFVWMHNKLVTVNSFTKALEALQRMSRTPRRYTTSTAIQAIKEATSSIGKQISSNLAEKYGDSAKLDRILYDEYRLTLKTIILKAWKKRRKVTSDVVLPIACYREIAPYEKRQLIEIEPLKCRPLEGCSLAALLKDRQNELWKMREAIKESLKPESKRRSKALRKLYRTPNRQMEEVDCLNLGDAIFVLFAPSDSVIITTNLEDYKPLCTALGKAVRSPQEILRESKSEKPS